MDYDFSASLGRLFSLALVLFTCFFWLAVVEAKRGKVACQELGLNWNGLRTLGYGLAVGLALVPFALLLGPFFEWLAIQVGLETWTPEKFNQFYGNGTLTLGAAIVIAFMAGFGEEILFRGLLQPRTGLVLSNGLFAGAHAFQYPIYGVLVVFTLGFILGVFRHRDGTSASAIAHATYNFVLLSSHL